jgi:hypothetical protein
MLRSRGGRRHRAGHGLGGDPDRGAGVALPAVRWPRRPARSRCGSPPRCGRVVRTRTRSASGSRRDGLLTARCSTRPKRSNAEDDDWGQPGTLVRDMLDDAARDRLVDNIVGPSSTGSPSPCWCAPSSTCGTSSRISATESRPASAPGSATPRRQERLPKGAPPEVTDLVVVTSVAGFVSQSDLSVRAVSALLDSGDGDTNRVG